MASGADAYARLSAAVSLQPDPKQALVFKVLYTRGRRSRLQAVLDQMVLHRAFTDGPRAAAVKDVRVLAEGDSWINLLYPISGYPPTLADRIDAAQGYFVHNVGWPGDTFQGILTGQVTQRRQLLESNTFDHFVFSGGGNDFIGGQALKSFLRPFPGGNPTPKDCLRMDDLEAALGTVANGYRRIDHEVATWTTRTTMLVHGYDHAIPRPGGPWLGTPLAARGYGVTSKLARDIIAFMVDRFYEVLAGVEDKAKRIRLVDCRGAVGSDWHDELHPNAQAAERVARRFLAKIGGTS